MNLRGVYGPERAQVEVAGTLPELSLLSIQEVMHLKKTDRHVSYTRPDTADHCCIVLSAHYDQESIIHETHFAIQLQAGPL